MNSIGNGEAKDLICMTHGGMMVEGGKGRRGIKGRKKWDNYNSIINKVYFLKLDT